jgi:hypothetical protein
MEMHSFRTMLIRYLTDGCISSGDKLLSYANNQIPFYKNAGAIISAFNSLNKPASSKSESFHIDPLITHSSEVKRITEYVQSELHDNLVAALVHGSIGTNEEIGYSDFDGLLILKNDIFKDKNKLIQTAIKISKSFSLMFAYDNLQHHSWFIILEHELSEFPDYYFPRELLKHSKSLYGNLNLEINASHYNFKSSRSLENLVNSIIKKTSNGRIPANNYEVKNLLSEFMLLPTLFIQKITGEGIFKKFSFEKAAAYFTDEEWLPMRTASQLRLNWTRPSNNLPFNPPVIVTSQLKSKLIKSSGTLSGDTLQAFQKGLLQQMNQLAQTMLKKSNEL